MWKIYDELIDGIPSGIKAEEVCFGPRRVMVSAEDNIGVSTLTSDCWEDGRLQHIDQLQGAPLRDIGCEG